VTATTLNSANGQTTMQDENSISTTSSGSGYAAQTDSLQTSTSETSESHSATVRNSVETGRFSSRASDKRIGLELNIPLFAGGGISARGRQAAALYVQASAELDKQREDIYFEIDRQHRLVQSYSQKAKALSDAVESSRFTLEATRKSMAGGIRTNLDVLNAQEQLVTAQRELANAKYSYLIAYLQLRYHAGVLSESALTLVGG
jgi:protease secretion system outer membrane protein